MGAGKVVGGIILMILGIVIYGVASTISNIQTRNIEECNSILGQLGQTLSPEGVRQCSNAPVYQSFGGVGIFLAVILVIIGIILVIVGAVSKKEVIKKFKSEEIREPPIMKSNYCRYCGKTKSSSADYCPSCGKSSSTSSRGLKLCKCVSLMAEDSLFCSECGQMFPSRTEQNNTKSENT